MSPTTLRYGLDSDTAASTMASLFAAISRGDVTVAVDGPIF